MGEYIEQFPSLEGCRLRRGGRFSFVIQSFHPHPHLLPSREKELLVVIARPGFLRSWQSHIHFLLFSHWIKGEVLGFDWFTKTQIPLTSFAKRGNSFLNRYFHCHLVPTFGMRVYPNLPDIHLVKKIPHFQLLVILTFF
ncbi:hypothetical protein RT761_01244 [Atribacter laminatus]|uniref:Uncharacterized protein n=1 Tax=Atribacter laminatus TaxID=2847778 RepID=A0A7T1ALB9_ATRLM|nr:hypothetical protein RT761_01244 [Atribacter laminatus]